MRKLLVFFALILPMISYAEEKIYDLSDLEETDFFDPNFYFEPRVEWDGHIWIAIWMRHHPDCPCFLGCPPTKGVYWED